YSTRIGKNTAKIQEYIKYQPEEDKMGAQLSILYPGSPFTGRN
ncbi:IS200/IS605 family transposase, partial [Escherichia coli]|nr:IS200/IS605 family transposase [Escherichia coli]